MREECGGSEYFEAEDWEEARVVAEEWVKEGEYGDKSCYVVYHLVEVDDDDEEVGGGERFSVLVERETVEPDCGMYKIYTSESTPGNYPIEPAYTEYEDADDASLDWVAGLKKLHS